MQLIDRSSTQGWVVSEEDRGLLPFYSGGHPYVAEMVLCKAWHTRSVSDGVERSVGHIFDYYEHIRSILEEDGLFDQLQQIAVGPRVSVSLAPLKGCSDTVLSSAPDRMDGTLPGRNTFRHIWTNAPEICR